MHMYLVRFLLAFIGIIFVIPCLSASGKTHAALKHFPQDKLCAFDRLIEVQVASISDRGVLKLTDGQRVRLVNMVFPERPHRRKSKSNAKTRYIKAAPAFPLKSIKVLRQWLDSRLRGKKVVLAFGRNDQHFDRYGRLLAHVFYQHNKRWLWVQQGLVAAGLARVRPWPHSFNCTVRLVGVEHRQYFAMESITKTGFCRGKAHLLGHLYANKHHFCVVRGKVLKVGRSRKNLYLNFDQDWRKDFTVIIPANKLKIFKKHGSNFTKFSGKRIEVRGWLDIWNGPYIRAEQPEQIKLLPSSLNAHQSPGSATRPSSP